MLYIFIFLHQTTTQHRCPQMSDQLYIFIFLHQTTTLLPTKKLLSCCISLYSYTKPQPTICSTLALQSCISLYSYTKPQLSYTTPAFHCVVYLYIPTPNHNLVSIMTFLKMLYIFIFLHQTTTCLATCLRCLLLYIFIFLHQTTTMSFTSNAVLGLYIFIFLHQTTT